jgi:hypothetical protein
MKRTIFPVLAGIALFCAPVAHADRAAIDEVVSGSGHETCIRLSHRLTGVPAEDLQVFSSQIDELKDFYSVSMHDASAAMGDIIADDCDQYGPNLTAATRYIDRENGE